MNHASGAVTPLDPEMVQVGDAVGQRAERSGLLEGAVRPVGVVEVLVVSQDGYRVPLVPDQGPVQQFSPAESVRYLALSHFRWWLDVPMCNDQS